MWLQDLLTLSSWHHTPNTGILNLLNEMATHSSVLAWRIPRTGEPGGLPSLGSHRVRHDWSNLVAAEATRLSFQSLSHFWLFEHHRLQHARLPCPSTTPGACSNSYHQVSDAVWPSHPLSSPSPPAFNFSQNQDHFQRVSSTHQVVKVLEFQLQHQSFQWIFRTGFL